MTDAELIARLRSNIFGTGTAMLASDRIEALTKERDEARQDAKAAEDELEMQEQEACMMENDYLKLEKERDALEAKLAKAVEALENVIGEYDLFRKDEYERGLAPLDDEIHEARATLADIKGESQDGQ